MKKSFLVLGAVALLIAAVPTVSFASTPLGVTQGLPAYDGGYPMPSITRCKSHYDPRAISGAYDDYGNDTKSPCRVPTPFSTVTEADGLIARLAVFSVHPQGVNVGQSKVLEATTLKAPQRALGANGTCDREASQCQPQVTGMQQFSLGTPVVVTAGLPLTIEWSTIGSQNYRYFYHTSSWGIGHSETANSSVTYVSTPLGINGSGPGFSPSGFYGTATVVPAVGPSTYTLNYGAGLASLSLTVNAVIRPAITVSANPTTVDNGKGTFISWSAINVTSCTVTGPSFTTANTVTGTQATGGLVNDGTTDISNTYTVTCNSSAGPASASVDVTVHPTPFSITANPTSVVSGGVSKLTWHGTDATNCSVGGPSFATSTASVGINVSTSPLINNGTTPLINNYVLSCKVTVKVLGINTSQTKSSTATVTVTAPLIPPPPVIPPAVLPTIGSFSASRAQKGAASTIAWNVSGLSASTTCAINPGAKIAGGTAPTWNKTGTTWQGSIKTTALTAPTTYTLSCTNSAGTVSATATSNLIPTVKEI